MRISKKLILASRSPRRQILLRQIGLEFEVRESGIIEEFDSRKSLEENVKILSERKARAVARPDDNAIIIGADTIVALGSEILGKPKDEREASHMLATLSSRTHEVCTGFSLLDLPSSMTTSSFEVTKVTFRTLSADEIREYVKNGSPMDKAGGYGIQDDYGAVFVEKVEGCFYNVVGFPLAKFYVTMQEFVKKLNQI